VIAVAVAAVVGVVISGFVAVPLHRFKELRPLTPRNVAAESGVTIRAVYRHARCPRCHHDNSARDWPPVISWFRGCPVCALPAPRTLVLVQLGLPLALAITAAVFDRVQDPAAYVTVVVAYGWFCLVATAVSVVDARVWLIPWWMPWVGAGVGLVLLGLAAGVLGEPERLLWAVGSAAAAFALFFVLFTAAPGKLGFGDVRLVVLIGLFAGFIDPLLVLWSLILGSILGVVVGVVSAARGRGSHFAFGPALTAGALLAIWFSEVLL